MTRRRIFITGASGLIGGAVVARLARRPENRITVLVRDPASWAAAERRLGLDRNRCEVVLGDVRAAGLGLDAATRRRLARSVTATIHLAADTAFSRPLEAARATNVEGTRNVLDASASWEGPFAFVSTAFVAGRRTGRILESHDGSRHGWVNAYEQSKWEAEQLVRTSGRGFVVLRSSTVVCDSVDGRITQHNAVHRALRLFHAGLAPMIPGSETTPVDLVPADYVADAIARLALREEAAGAKYHLCAGEGAIPLGEMLALTHATWSRDPAWRRRGIALPVLSDLHVYRLFERSVEEAADERLKQVTRSLSHFVPQLALGKWFDTRGADAALGHRAPSVREYWEAVATSLVAGRWTAARTAALGTGGTTVRPAGATAGLALTRRRP